MRRATLDKLKETYKDIDEKRIRRAVRPSPGWCEARYLRTIGWLTDNRFGQREHVLLWAFALLDGQLGFALDLALEYERAFGKSVIPEAMESEPLRRLRKSNQPLRRAVGKIVPQSLWRRTS